jgi:hypothetical protein
MRNMVVLQKNDDGSVHCRQLSEEGIVHAKSTESTDDMWEEGGTILLDELEEILDREV